VREQAAHSPHAYITQSIGQGWVWHERLSLADGQTTPPSDADVVTLRERDWLPAPQLTEHVVQPPKLLMVQSTGQFCELQLCVCDKSGHT